MLLSARCSVAALGMAVVALLLLLSGEEWAMQTSYLYLRFQSALPHASALWRTSSSSSPARRPFQDGYVIALPRGGFDPGPLRAEIVENLTVVEALDGRDVDSASLPLYTQHVMRTGRSDHLQLPNRAAVGCLLSHAEVWRRVAESRAPVAVVFEEDVLVGTQSAGLLHRVMQSLREDLAPGRDWDLVMLDPGHLNTGGRWAPVRPASLITNCTGGRCAWYGTRAYAIRPRAAALLLEHVRPVVLQVDSLITLVAEYRGLRMLSVAAPIFPVNLTRPSLIFDGCIKCYLPTQQSPYWLVVILVIALMNRGALARGGLNFLKFLRVV